MATHGPAAAMQGSSLNDLLASVAECGTFGSPSCEVVEDSQGSCRHALATSNSSPSPLGSTKPQETGPETPSRTASENEPREKPTKPYLGFPLFPHANGQWAKKVHGRFHYFGPWMDWEAALKKYQSQADDLQAGRADTPHTGLTIHSLCERFLVAKHNKFQTGDLSPLMLMRYREATSILVAVFGGQRNAGDLQAADFACLRKRIADRWGPVTVANTIQMVRTIFQFATKNQLVAQPVLYGTEFMPPPRRVIRAARQARGPRMFEAKELQVILEQSREAMRAMILLGINCGFGNHDVTSLSTAHLDLDRGWVDFPRPKTAIPRRCPLWPETVQALRETLTHRRRAVSKAHVDLVFITTAGKAYHNDVENYAKLSSDPTATVHGNAVVSTAFRRLLTKLGIYRAGLGFYALRHTFETIAGDTRDQVAVDSIMGHDRGDMATVYRERIDPDRLWAVVYHVHHWLWAKELDSANDLQRQLGDLGRPTEPEDLALFSSLVGDPQGRERRG